LKKKYIHVEDPLGGEDPMGNDRQILAQHEGDTSADRYFCLHDRLDSVRLAIDDEGAVQNYYTYEPFGQTIESGGTLDNPFRFTGQLYDEDVLVQRELDDFHLRLGE